MEEGSELVKDLEIELAKDLQELKNEIEENDLVHGIPNKGMRYLEQLLVSELFALLFNDFIFCEYSSLHVAKDAEYFKQERKFALRRSLQVSEAKPLTIQADIMKEEIDACEKFEFTDRSLPLLTHQVISREPFLIDLYPMFYDAVFSRSNARTCNNSAFSFASMEKIFSTY